MIKPLLKSVRPEGCVPTPIEYSEPLTVKRAKQKQGDRSLADRLIFEELLSELSARFVNLPDERIDAEIHDAMSKFMKFFKVDRFGLVKLSPEKNTWMVTHCVSKPGVPKVPVGVDLPMSIRKWAYHKLVIQREVVAFAKLDDLPPEAEDDKKYYLEWGVRSTLNIPISIHNTVHHVIVINAVKHERVWPQQFIPRLKLLGEVFVNALEQKQSLLELEKQLQFERLLADISEKFVNLPPEQVDSEIEDAQSRVCQFLDVDVCALWQWSTEEPRKLSMTHLYRPLGGHPRPDPMYAHAYFPWCEKQVMAGKVVVISSMDDFPLEAARDKEVSCHFGIKSSLTFPLSSEGGKIVGALSFNSMLTEHTWPESMIQRLQLVAQIFINALLRKQAEIALQESESRLRMTTDAVGAGLWIMEIETKKVWVSPKIRNYFQFSPNEELFYESFFRSIHPEDRERVDRIVQEAIQTGKTFRCDFRIVSNHGDVKWIASRGQSFLKSNGSTGNIMGLSLDITERKEMELKLEHSQTLLDSLINSTDDLIWSVDAEHFGLLTFNKALEQYFLMGRGISIKTGMTPYDLLPTDELAKKWCDFYQKALETGSFTTDYQTSTGGQILRLNINTVDKNDTVFGISVFGHDITQRITMEKEMEKHLADIQTLKARLENENFYLRKEIKIEKGFDKIIGSSDTLQYVLFRARQVAPTDATALILGETGVGKGMVANAIHEMSNRNKKPMITVNCAALPANLIESELFGREKGAFTGAHATQPGRFEVADGGTIFLDEIGELPLELQSKLLRVLQDGEFERLGSTKTLKVNVRVITSTSRDLRAEMRNGRFREDLYYRLNVFPISLPPLRQRIDDIPELAWHFVNKHARKMGKHFESISGDDMGNLKAYNWPGNVRELEHVIERAIITSQEPEVRILDQLECDHDKQKVPLEEFNMMAREHILHVLQKTGWKIEGNGGAAAILGLNPSTLRFRIKKLGIQHP
jgi:PAS domain S-box-containing protein